MERCLFDLSSSGNPITGMFDFPMPRWLVSIGRIFYPICLPCEPPSAMGKEWTSVFEALAFSGIAFILAGLPVSNRFSISSSEESRTIPAVYKSA